MADIKTKNLLADPGDARGCSTNPVVVDSFIRLVTLFDPPTTLWRRHTQTVRESSSRFKIDYVAQVKDILNPEVYQNHIISSKIMAIFLDRWILIIGGVAAGFFSLNRPWTIQS